MVFFNNGKEPIYEKAAEISAWCGCMGSCGDGDDGGGCNEVQLKVVTVHDIIQMWRKYDFKTADDFYIFNRSNGKVSKMSIDTQ